MKRKLTDISHGKFVVSFREVKQNENRKNGKTKKTTNYFAKYIKIPNSSDQS